MSNIIDKLLETASALNEDAYARHQQRKLVEGNKKIDEIDKKIDSERKKTEFGKSDKTLRQLEKDKERIEQSHAVKGQVQGSGTHFEIRPAGKDNISDTYSGNVYSMGDTILNPRNKNSLRKDGNESSRKSAEPKNAALHDRINKRSEKYTPADKKSTQHESAVKLAELLVEAANILLETENK